MRWFDKKGMSLMTVFLSALFVLFFCSTVYAAGINIDASFDDWNGIDKVNISSETDNFESAALVWSGDRVYLYAKEKVGKSCTISGGQQFAFVTNEGKKVDFTTYQTSWTWQEPTRTLDIRTTSYQEIEDTHGKGQFLSDNYQWELSFPISMFGNNPKSISLTDASGKVLIDSVKSSVVPTPSKTPKPTVKPTAKPSAKPTVKPTDKVDSTPEPTSEPLPSGPIVIDGYYDDWKELDQDDAFTWYSNNTMCSHIGGIFMDDEKVYVHVKLHKYYISQIPLDALTFTVNGDKSFTFAAQYKNADNSINYGGNTYNLPVGQTTMLGVFYNEYPKYYMGDIAVTIPQKQVLTENGQPVRYPQDQYEFSVDLDVISKITGIPVESIKSISFSCKNLGGDAITTSGTPTGAFVGIAISIVVVAAVLVTRRIRRRKRETL